MRRWALAPCTHSLAPILSVQALHGVGTRSFERFCQTDCRGSAHEGVAQRETCCRPARQAIEVIHRCSFCATTYPTASLFCRQTVLESSKGRPRGPTSCEICE